MIWSRLLKFVSALWFLGGVIIMAPHISFTLDVKGATDAARLATLLVQAFIFWKVGTNVGLIAKNKRLKVAQEAQAELHNRLSDTVAPM